MAKRFGARYILLGPGSKPVLEKLRCEGIVEVLEFSIGTGVKVYVVARAGVNKSRLRKIASYEKKHWGE